MNNNYRKIWTDMQSTETAFTLQWKKKWGLLSRWITLLKNPSCRAQLGGKGTSALISPFLFFSGVRCDSTEVNEQIILKGPGPGLHCAILCPCSNLHVSVKLCFSKSIRVLWCYLGCLSLPLKPIFKLMAALIEGSGIIFGTHHKCLLVSWNAPVIIKWWVPCHHLLLCFSSRSMLSFSMKYLNVSDMALLSVFFLAPLSCYWNINTCL